jgi:Response regulators consisting of a CheY-like receiver domain and a winged-helix DNA-binding domain
MSENGSVAKNILVVDDEGALLKFTKARLEANGYAVSTLDSGNRAAEYAARDKPDLILMDIRMPGKSGYDVCRELKAYEVTRNIPVILFTAQYMDEECVEAETKSVGADDYMFKPFDAHILLAKIKALLKTEE